MRILAPPNKVAPNTPPSVIVTMEAPPPVGAPDLGVPVPPSGRSEAAVPLVTIGDSLTHGFQSGAIFNTDLSWPALVAKSAGDYTTFLRPHYDKFGGLPINIEYLQRQLEEKYGPNIKGLTLVEALMFLRGCLSDICHYWQDGDGAIVPPYAYTNNNLATFGYDLRDAISLRPADILNTIAGTHENVLLPLVSHGKERAALRTLPYYDPADPAHLSLSAIEAATRLGSNGGIDTLVVILGANNVLGVTMDLELKWSQDADFNDPVAKGKYNIWQPQHFAAEFADVAALVRGIDARRVIFGTVPHVTIAPLLHGIGHKVVDAGRKISRFFPYYSRPWFDFNNFNPKRDPHLTENDARTVDSVIDQYNETIVATVKAARENGLDWLVLDLRTMLDRLAYRRYVEAPNNPPAWWTPYILPPQLAALNPVPTTQFWQSDTAGRTQGGIIALDGIHPTTVGYGLMAQEVINVMTSAGVPGLTPVDFDWLLQVDSLMSSPPKGFDNSFALVRWFDEHFEFFTHLFGPGAPT